MNASGVSLVDFATAFSKSQTATVATDRIFNAVNVWYGGNPACETQDQTQEKKACGTKLEQP
jgi:hypothetical protein